MWWHLGVLLVLGVTAAACGREAPPSAERTYVGREACASCHEEVALAWQGSDHDRAMEPATAATVQGDFDGATFVHFGDTTRFFREGEAFLVRTEGPAGVVDTFEVQYTFGYAPLQQYLVPLGGGRLQALTVAWDDEQARWFSLYPDQDIPHGDELHWTGPAMNWNYMCAACHSTNLQKNFDLATDTYQTTFSEIDVSCEACHGPGSAHVAWARAAAAGEAEPEGGRERFALTADLAQQDEQIDACAPCHSRRRPIAEGFTPGDDYLDYYGPELLHEGLYFADGQIRDEVYVYASFLQSKMYHNGVRCSDCHDPHTTRLKREGNALCTACHAPAHYDVAEHLRHAPETPGAACVDCHMPERTYMVVDPRRDHRFLVPQPGLAAELGVPDPCTGCHADQPAAWAARYVKSWYGPERSSTYRFARTFAAARGAEAGAGSEVAQVATDPAMPAVVRATAVELLAPYTAPAAQEAVRASLHDASPLVRAAAVRVLASADEASHSAALLVPLLDDPVRLVRIEAARALALAGPPQRGLGLSEAQQAAFEQALNEYVASQHVAADQPGSHVNLAVVREALGERAAAEAAYRTALRIDSTFVPAHLNLSMLLNGRRVAEQRAGRSGEAAALRTQTAIQLRAALRHEPGLAEAHYMLGLLLAEDEAMLEAAAEHLATAARLAPQRPRMQYNAGLAFQHLGHAERAERFLLAAQRLAPTDVDYLNALSIFYIQQEQWTRALEYTRLLQAQHPQDRSVRQRLQFIQRRAQP